MMNSQARPFWKRVVLNLSAMAAICIALFLIVAYGLDLWTHHGSEIVVPDVKGMTYDEARNLLDDNGFDVVLQDSVYEDNVKPGMVVEQSPADMAVVKPGRTVYLTVNAFYPRTITLPSLTDISERQARTTLEGIGFKNITTREVPSEYDGLVFAITANGHHVGAGSKVPLTAKIVLEVGVQINAVSAINDSIHQNIEEVESEEHIETVTETPSDAPSAHSAQPATTVDDPDLFD